MNSKSQFTTQEKEKARSMRRWSFLCAIEGPEADRVTASLSRYEFVFVFAFVVSLVEAPTAPPLMDARLVRASGLKVTPRGWAGAPPRGPALPGCSGGGEELKGRSVVERLLICRLEPLL